MFDAAGLKMEISDDVRSEAETTIACRRDIHAHPELGHEEKRTQQLICDALTEAGIEHHRLGSTGVIGLIDSGNPGPTLLIRADMDALPVTEENDVPYKSTYEGKMHACGHDCHVAMLLSAARIMKTRGLERGRVKLMFQPAEEGGGGAKMLMEAGALENPKVDGSLAFHVWSSVPAGQVGCIEGPAMASVDAFRAVIAGKGTHAAMPEEGIDPILISTQIIGAAQTLISRRVSPKDMAVLSFTSIHGGTAYNIIPPSVELKGTIRAFDEEIRQMVRRELIAIAEATAGAMHGSVVFEWFEDLAPTVNDVEMARLANHVARGIVSDKNVVTPAVSLGGEDMGLIQAVVPGAFVFIGASNPEIGADYPHHHPKFNIDERVLPIGVEMALKFADEFLSR